MSQFASRFPYYVSRCGLGFVTVLANMSRVTKWVFVRVMARMTGTCYP